MARRGGLIQASVQVEFPADIDLSEIQKAINDGLEGIAVEVEAEAKNTSSFADKTGLLRSKIKKRKSPDGDGFIVEARAPHAHLVEFGHAQVTRDGRTVGFTKKHSFLRTAKEKVLMGVVNKLK